MSTWLRFIAAVAAASSMCWTGCRSAKPAARAPAEEHLSAKAQVALAQDAAAREDAIEHRVKVFANFLTGLSLELNNEPDEALGYYYEAALADPTQDELVLEVSRRLLQRQETDKAIALLEKATALPSSPALLDLHLGLALAQANKHEQAIAAYRQALKESPKLLLAYQNLAQLYLHLNRPKDALAVLDEAANLPDLEAARLVDLAEVYAALMRVKPASDKEPADKAEPTPPNGATPDGAREARPPTEPKQDEKLKATEVEALKTRATAMLDRANKLKPENPFLLQKIAEGYKSLGALAKATDVYLQLLEKFPRQPGLREKLTEIYLRSGDKKKAVEQLEAISRDHPTNPTAHYFLAGIAAEEKQFDKAIEYFQRVLLLKPEFEAAYYELAGLQIMHDRAAEAVATLDKAAGKFKPNFLAEFYRGMAYSVQKKYAETVRHLMAAEVIASANEKEGATPTFPIRQEVFYFQLGAAHERTGQYADAEKAFRKCLQLSPNNADALNYLGYMWAEKGVNLGEARTMIEKAVALEPKNAAYLDSLGWVFFKLDQPQEALKWLLEAVKHLEKPDATIYDHLGDVYTALKQYEQAREAWKKSLETEDSELVRKKLDASPRGERSAN
jgi:tetratricopeptide (TPR) repeat protein